MTRTGTTVGAAVVWTVLALHSAPAAGQTPTAAAATVATAPPAVGAPDQPTVIPASEIPGRLAQTAALIRRANGHAAPLGRVQEIEHALPRFREGTRALLATSMELLNGKASPAVARELRNGWGVIGRRLGSWQIMLAERSRSLQQDLDALEADAGTWTLALDTAAARQLPDDLRAAIADTLEAIRRTEQPVLARRNAVLKLQSEVSRLSSDLEEMGERLDAALEAERARLFQFDAPPIWSARPAPPVAVRPEGARTESAESMSEVVQYYLLSILEFAAIESSVFIGFLAALFLLRRRAAAYRQDEDEAIRRLGFAIGRPLATAILLTTVGAAAGPATAPTYLLGLGWYAMLVPLVRLVPGLSPPGLKPFLWALAGLYLASGALTLLPAYSVASRLLLLLVALAEGAVLVFYERRLRRSGATGPWPRLALFGVRAAVALLAVACLSEVAGAMNLGRHLERAVLRSVYAAAGLYAFLVVLRGVLDVLIRSLSRRSGALWRMPVELTRALSSGLTWLAVVLYATLLLRAFELWDDLLAWVRLILGHEITIGVLVFTVGSAVTFAGVLAAAAILSRVLRFFLGAGLQGRLELQRGKTEAISRLLHYAILTLGFLLALGASGVDLNKFTVLAGALGVGLGFGLQNIVNNFVSGLILLFERPLQVGDKITVGDTSGEVKDIGIRASTVATWDGADVIIPNASLISGTVTNWTLTDDRRRSEVQVGVAYGTDPQTVLRILRETARNHPQVLAEPEPIGLFVGFGDSSLDFRLRFWTRLDHSVDVTSQLHVALCERLAAEGIEIPFPQRDIHVKDGSLTGAGESSRDD